MGRLAYRGVVLPSILLLGAALLLGCARAAPTPAPTPTPTPTPTPLPSQSSLVSGVFPESFNPAPDPVQLKKLSHLLSLAPLDYGPAAFLDVREIQENPELLQAMQLNQLGFAGALLGSGASAVRAVAVAVTRDGQGTIIALDGPIEIERLLQAVSGLGVTTGSEPEEYRGFQVWSGDAFGLVSLALARVDQETIVLSQGAIDSGVSALEQVKAALDTFSGRSPPLLDNPDLAALAGDVPSGILTTLLGDCAPLEDLSIAEGAATCNALAISVEVVSGQTVVINLLAVFPSEPQAEAAVNEAMQAKVSPDQLALREVAVRREGAKVRARATGEASEALERIGSLVMQR